MQTEVENRIADELETLVRRHPAAFVGGMRL